MRRVKLKGLKLPYWRLISKYASWMSHDATRHVKKDMLSANTVLKYRPVNFVTYKENNRNKYASWIHILIFRSLISFNDAPCLKLINNSILSHTTNMSILRRLRVIPPTCPFWCDRSHVWQYKGKFSMNTISIFLHYLLSQLWRIFESLFFNLFKSTV